MNSFLIVLLALSAVTAYPKDGVQRIVGGSVTTINQYPEMASLMFSWGTTGHRQSCGGAVINNRSILTAAHCTIGDAAARWRSRMGSTNANSGGIIRDTSLIINHAQYNSRTLDNDIAIIRVVGTIAFSNVVRAARIGTFQIADNQVVWVAGWGRTAENGPVSEQLRHVQIWTINQAVCRQRYASLGATITDNMLCTGWLDVGGRDACQGDSGGPVFNNGVVVGVTSWGQGCARAQFPGVNARVSRYGNWISQNA